MGDAVTKLDVCIGYLTMFQESQLDPCSTLEHQTWSNNQSQHDLLHGLSVYRLFKSDTRPSAPPTSEMANS